MIVAWFEIEASTDPAKWEAQLASADRMRKTQDGKLMIAWEVSEYATLAHNLAMIGGLFASFRAGDNFGFHMGADELQCTCQWSPSRGVPFFASKHCENDDYEGPGPEDMHASDVKDGW